MRGTHKLTIQSVFLKYEMEFSRNLTILQGNSATGKTTLVDMVREYNLNGSDTGIQLTCDRPCRVIEGNTWEEQLAGIEDSIVFVDEGNRFIASTDFARKIRGTSNYYVLVTRESLDNLPYSVTEIYGIRSSGKYGSLEPVYHHMYRIYGEDLLKGGLDCRTMIVEDSNSGFEFFDALCAKAGLICQSAGGAGKVFECINSQAADNGVTVVADGAAFGSQIGRIYQLMIRRGNIRLYLPESFEWILLSSDVLENPDIRRILSDPSQFIDGCDYFSWEQYFTSLLIEKTTDTWMKYGKSKLNPVYLQGKICQKIIESLPEAIKRMLEVR